jgi:hemoglobin-like flavoprotein
MLGMVVDMLGPELDVVEEQLYDLGKSHTRYGVSPMQFELRGKALAETLLKILGRRSFTDKTEKAWKETYEFMSITMIRGAAGI